jgi:hypothetical protein
MKYVTVTLTMREAKALDALAEEGAAGLLTDEEAGRAYLNGKQGMLAAERACIKLTDAIRKAGGYR